MTRQFFSILISVAAIASAAAVTDDGVARSGAGAPVLAHSEPPDSAIVKLPGPPPEPAPPVAPAPAQAVDTHPQDAFPDAPRPFLHRVARAYPQGFAEDTPRFLQQRIGQWRAFDADDLLGKSLRTRPALDDDGKPNGVILAYADPTGQFKEFELDFAGDSGELRTVFMYPLKMTWQTCRQVYGASVTAADAAHGRRFYSYLNRRLDVLVDPSGKVVSLGFY